MKRMYLDGSAVVGPSMPSKCRICVESSVNSQSSMNSHKCESPASLASLTRPMIESSVSTMAFLYAKPPSSRSTFERKVISSRCFCGNLRHIARMASTTTILKSSAISDMKEVICFISRSTPDSEPVLSSVVMASVAIERFESLISPSMSMLQGVTASGCAIASLFRVRTAENLHAGLGEHRKSCNTVTDGESSRCVTLGSEQMAVAAS
mmetsp:Transcript_59614/g.136746  ORF Transcript_59614/g.136746 Transcript_59614/m.136746 type:complete len:209 (+) Transcript_59614:1733-2359(+)